MRKWERKRADRAHRYRLHRRVDRAFKLSKLRFTTLQAINNAAVHNETFSAVSYRAPAKFSPAGIYSATISERAAEFISRLHNHGPARKNTPRGPPAISSRRPCASNGNRNITRKTDIANESSVTSADERGRVLINDK